MSCLFLWPCLKFLFFRTCFLLFFVWWYCLWSLHITRNMFNFYLTIRGKVRKWIYYSFPSKATFVATTKIIRDLQYVYILSSSIPNLVINITLTPLTMMLHRRKKLRTNLIKEMKLIYGEMSMKVRKCVPEKVFQKTEKTK
jgi:hypothetical protein